LATTGIVIRVVFAFDFGQPFNRKAHSLGLWASFLVVAAIPVSGAILEVFGSRFAKWINMGFWILLATYYLVGAMLEWSDPFGPLVLIIGITLLIPAGVSYLLYRNREA